MSHAPPTMVRPLPVWLLGVGSLLILFHLSALGIYVLAAPSGPWPNGMGGTMPIQGPQFAVQTGNSSIPVRWGRLRLDLGPLTYLRLLKMTHNYHYLTNRPGYPGVKAEVRLKDETGKVIKTVPLPDPKANFWVQHRQPLLVRGLAEDQMVDPPMNEIIPAAGHKAATVDIWDGPRKEEMASVPRKPSMEDMYVVIHPVEQHLISREGPVFRPSAFSRVLARSYVRYLCRETGAASGEVIRISRDPVMPMLLTMEETPPGAYRLLTSNFGETPR